MTPTEMRQGYQKLEAELIDLSDDPISAFNYQKIMRRYQELVLTLIRLGKEQAKLMEMALAPSTVTTAESDKEKSNG